MLVMISCSRNDVGFCPMLALYGRAWRRLVGTGRERL